MSRTKLFISTELATLVEEEMYRIYAIWINIEISPKVAAAEWLPIPTALIHKPPKDTFYEGRNDRERSYFENFISLI